MALVTRIGGVYVAFASGIDFNPNTDLTYTGSYAIIDDGDGNWRVKFLTSGVLTVALSVLIDAFLVGGGGGGGALNSHAAGGGGGYTATHSSIVINSGDSISVAVGAGGAVEANGGRSWFMSSSQYYADGGYGTNPSNGYAGKGGSGGGGDGGAGGSNGSNGYGSFNRGTGQGTTTYEFATAGTTLYAGGGGANNNLGGAGGGGNYLTNGTTNLGGGGGYAASGGSGIVVIRNHRAA